MLNIYSVISNNGWCTSWVMKVDWRDSEPIPNYLLCTSFFSASKWIFAWATAASLAATHWALVWSIITFSCCACCNSVIAVYREWKQIENRHLFLVSHSGLNTQKWANLNPILDLTMSDFIKYIELISIMKTIESWLRGTSHYSNDETQYTDSDWAWEGSFWWAESRLLSSLYSLSLDHIVIKCDFTGKCWSSEILFGGMQIKHGGSQLTWGIMGTCREIWVAFEPLSGKWMIPFQT